MLQWLRRLLLTMLRPTTWALGYVTRPKTVVTEEAYHDIRQTIQPGDVVLLRSKWRPTNIFIPGFWSHAALYVGEGKTIDAAFPEVRRSTLMELMLRADYIAVMRPSRFTARELQKAVEYAERAVGEPYDFMFDPGHNALYCSELCWHALKLAKPAWKFVARERMGVATVTPQDLYDSREMRLLRELK